MRLLSLASISAWKQSHTRQSILHRSCLFSLLGKCRHYLPYLPTQLFEKLLTISQKWSAMLLWFTCASSLSLRQNDIFFFNSVLISILLPGVSNCQAGLQPAQGWMLERSQLFILYPLPPSEHVSFSVLLKMWACFTVLFCLRHLCKPQLILGFRPVLKTSPQALTVSSF